MFIEPVIAGMRVGAKKKMRMRAKIKLAFETPLSLCFSL